MVSEGLNNNELNQLIYDHQRSIILMEKELKILDNKEVKRIKQVTRLSNKWEKKEIILKEGERLHPNYKTVRRKNLNKLERLRKEDSRFNKLQQQIKLSKEYLNKLISKNITYED